MYIGPPGEAYTNVDQSFCKRERNTTSISLPLSQQWDHSREEHIGEGNEFSCVALSKPF